MTGRPLSRRHTLKTAAGAAAALTVAAAPAASASGGGSGTGSGRAGKPTVVLVHGAFADASSWNPVIERLQQYGHPVLAVANPLRGLAHDAAQVAARLAAVPGPDGTTGVDLYIRPDRYHEVFAQDVARSTTAVLAAGQRPLGGSAFTDRVSSAAWHTVPSWTLISTRDRGIVPELQRFQASRARSRTVEVPSSHMPMHSRPDAVAALIRSAARTVTS
ncbi:alpha/beta fold hydrolase [Streptomyces sp. WM6368]|uniref:alpha/beta fold hydrolase n=1 Tax=Streptomyces sp. WM6368 TaxID=1415554 RepID=UPI0006AEA035|nr:alpha/beta hydrolase [Streptomyces sp. WM6368]